MFGSIVFFASLHVSFQPTVALIACSEVADIWLDAVHNCTKHEGIFLSLPVIQNNVFLDVINDTLAKLDIEAEEAIWTGNYQTNSGLNDYATAKHEEEYVLNREYVCGAVKVENSWPVNPSLLNCENRLSRICQISGRGYLHEDVRDWYEASRACTLYLPFVTYKPKATPVGLEVWYWVRHAEKLKWEQIPRVNADLWKCGTVSRGNESWNFEGIDCTSTRRYACQFNTSRVPDGFIECTIPSATTGLGPELNRSTDHFTNLNGRIIKHDTVGAGVYVAVILTILCIVVLIVVFGFCLWKRRNGGNPFKTKDTKQTGSIHVVQHDATYDTYRNDAQIISNAIPQDGNDAVYSIPIPKPPRHLHQRTGREDETAVEYSNAGTSDQSVDKNVYANVPDDRMLHADDAMESSTYDSTNYRKTVTNNKENQSNNVYNSLAGVISEEDDDGYGTTSDVNQRQVETDTDTYDHVTGGTDNLYSHTGATARIQQDSVYDHV